MHSTTCLSRTMIHAHVGVVCFEKLTDFIYDVMDRNVSSRYDFCKVVLVQKRPSNKFFL